MDRIPLLAVAGRPVYQSRSPEMFNRAFAADGLAGAYVRLAARTAEDALRFAAGLGLAGLNATSPLKMPLAGLMDELDPAAASIGAVNTVVFKEGKRKGFNTDAAGVIKALETTGLDLRNRRFVVLGAGGAGRAAAFSLKREGAKVTVVNRTFDKACRAAADFGVEAARLPELRGLLSAADGLVVAISGRETPAEPGWLRKGSVLLDARYPESFFSEAASGRGCRVVSGETWLFHQALQAYRLFTGHPASEKAMSEGLRSAGPLRKKANVALIGFSGSGKSAVGGALAGRLGWRFADLDALIEEAEGRTVTEVFAFRGEDGFRRAEAAVLQNLGRKRRWVLSCGGGAVLSEANRALLRQNATVVWLYASLETCLGRVAAETRPLLSGDDPQARAGRLWEVRLPLYGETADLVVGSESPASEVAAEIHEEIGPSLED